MSIRICSAAFANFFESCCGNGHLNKRLPRFWNALSDSNLKKLLAGCIDGDGSVGLNNVSFHSTSLRLVNDIRLAMTRFGRYSNINHRKKYTDNRKTSNPKIWNRLYYLTYGFGIIDIIGLEGKHRRKEGSPRWLVVDGGFAVSIASISREHYVGPVYNIQVDSDETYCLLNCSVHNCHYVSAADAYTQKIMMAIDQKVAVDDPGLFYTNSEQQYLKTRAELWATFHNYGYSAHVKDAVFDRICDNTLLVADRCEKLHPDTAPKIPSWDTIEPGVDPDERLRELTYNGLRARGLDKDEVRWPVDGKMVTYVEQTEIELERFINKGFASYFLITHDLITWGKQQGWPFGPRGSAGGSLVCFLLNIHSLNPLLWGLSFDRFMASSRGGYQLRVQME